MNIQQFSSETNLGDIMLTIVIRTVILYFFLIMIVRLMGKRQIGQLQPGELVITIMISEIAVLPLQDIKASIFDAIIPVSVLAILEIGVSFIALKTVKLRTLLQGNSVIVIKDGCPDVKQMRKLRYTTDDLLEALRQKDVFDIADVQYAIAETDGSLSVLLKPEKRNATVSDVNVQPKKNSLPRVIIADGRLFSEQLEKSVLTDEDVVKILKKHNAKQKDILLLTVDDNGNVNVIKKQ